MKLKKPINLESTRIVKLEMTRVETSSGNLKWKPQVETASSLIRSIKKFKVGTANHLKTRNLKVNDLKASKRSGIQVLTA